MPAIADQVATIEHDLAVAQTTCDSLRSENDQLKTALAALNADHGALQAKHIDALALLDETRVHADGVASAALAMLKVSRRQIVVAPSEGTKALLNMAPLVSLNDVMRSDAEALAAVTAAMEPEKTDVRPDLPEAEPGFSPEMQDALRQDAEKLSQMTGEEHSVKFIHEGAVLGDEIPNTDRLRAHMPGEDPLPIFLKPRAVPDANVLG